MTKKVKRVTDRQCTKELRSVKSVCVNVLYKLESCMQYVY